MRTRRIHKKVQRKLNKVIRNHAGNIIINKTTIPGDRYEKKTPAVWIFQVTN